MIKVLYEDNHLIAVFKPAGILSQPSQSAPLRHKALFAGKTGDLSMFNEVKHYLKEKYHKPGKVFLGLLHRLDRPVSGIILFAKTSKGASRLSEQFKNHQVLKTYHAIIIGKLHQSRGVLTNKLIKDKKLKKGREKSTGKEARLYYEIIPMPKASRMLDKISIKPNNNYSLLKINIEGGQFHQIRAQLSLAGFPILGDVKYGGEKWHDEKGIALSASHLSFRTATGEKIINLSLPLPKDWEMYLPR